MEIKENMRIDKMNKILKDLLESASSDEPSTSSQNEYKPSTSEFSNNKRPEWSANLRVKTVASEKGYILVHKHYYTPDNVNAKEAFSIDFYRAKNFDIAKRFVNRNIRDTIDQLLALRALHKRAEINDFQFNVRKEDNTIFGCIKYTFSSGKNTDVYYLTDIKSIDEEKLAQKEMQSDGIDILEAFSILNISRD